MVRIQNKPKKVKPPKPHIVIGPDDKLLVMVQRGGKLKAHLVAGPGKRLSEALLVVESREDLMFVKEEYKFFQDELRKLEAKYRETIRVLTKDFFGVLEHSHVYRPHRVKLKWES